MLQFPFLFKAGHYGLVWMDHIVLIHHPSVDTSVASVPENIAAIHVGVQIPAGDSASGLLERYPEVELLGHTLILFLI